MRQPIKNGIRHPQAATVAAHRFAENIADGRGNENRNLLAGGLERGIEPLCRAWKSRKIDRHAAKFDAGGKALQQRPISTMTGAATPMVA